MGLGTKSLNVSNSFSAPLVADDPLVVADSVDEPGVPVPVPTFALRFFSGTGVTISVIGSVNVLDSHPHDLLCPSDLYVIGNTRRSSSVDIIPALRTRRTIATSLAGRAFPRFHT